MKRKVLICGASGFIGRNMALALAEDDRWEVWGVHWTRPVPEHPRIRAIQADLTQPEEVRRVVAGMDVIIQAAASTSGAGDIVKRPHIHVTDNAVMNSLLLRAAYECDVKHFIFFSCTVMYPSSEIPLKEEDFNPAQPMHHHYFGVGWTKVYIEQMCAFFAGLGRTRHTVIRHSNIYGPHDKFDLERSHVFGATMTKVLTCTEDFITLWGSGLEKRDLLHVQDLVELVRLALERQESSYELVNVGCGVAVSVNELAAAIIACSGRSLAIRHDRTKPTIPTQLALDCAKAERLFGWKPCISLEEGIRQTMAWYRQHLLPP